MGKMMLLIEGDQNMGSAMAVESAATKKVLVKDRRAASNAKRSGKPHVVLLVRQDAQAA